MLTTHKCNYPIRIFRSSKCRIHAPPYGEKKKTQYRYDGLYIIEKVVKQEEETVSATTTPTASANAGFYYIFHLVRLKKSYQFVVNAAVNPSSKCLCTIVEPFSRRPKKMRYRI